MVKKIISNSTVDWEWECSYDFQGRPDTQKY